MHRSFFIGCIAIGLSACGQRPSARSASPDEPTARPTERVRIAEPVVRVAKLPDDAWPVVLPPRPTERELFGAPVVRLPDPTTTDFTALLSAAKLPGIGPRPSHCAAWASRTPVSRPLSLTDALATNDPVTRDASLVALRDEIPRSILASLRADHAPVECADGITDPELIGPSPMTRPASDLLVGLSIASKLARTSDAVAIDALKTALSGLRGYASAAPLLEAGMADLRASITRADPSRKASGRDAILTAFGRFAEAGVLRNARVTAARAALVSAFPAERIDALDDLLLPPLSPFRPLPANPAERALAATSPYWFSAMPDVFLAAASFVPALQVGVPVRACFASSCPYYARARIELGRLYWRRLDFVEAAHAIHEAMRLIDSPSSRLLLALARDLSEGPSDAVDRMSRRGPALGLQETRALDALAKWPSEVAGIAAYDAASIRELATPEDDTAQAWVDDVARRFEDSAKLLSAPNDQRRAHERAREIRARR